MHFNNRPDVFNDIENPFDFKWFSEILDSKSSEIFVAEDSLKEIVAYAVIAFTNSTYIPLLKPRFYCYVEDICVKKSQNRKGIGTKLMQFLMEFAKSKCAESLELRVWEFNQNAMKFYESIGMTTKHRLMEIKL